MTLRICVGLKIEEAAEMPGISEAAAKRWWASARAWLFPEIQPVSTPISRAEVHEQSRGSIPFTRSTSLWSLFAR